MEQEIDRQIGALSAVMWMLKQSVVVKRELSQKAHSSQFTGQFVSQFSPMVMALRSENANTSAEISFFLQGGWVQP